MPEVLCERIGNIFCITDPPSGRPGFRQVTQGKGNTCHRYEPDPFEDYGSAPPAE